MIRHRGPQNPKTPKPAPTTSMDQSADDARQPLLGSTEPTALSTRSTSCPPLEVTQEEGEGANKMALSRKSQWIVLAVASGACAAFNGVFAKLTTTELTTTFATAIANLLGLSNVEKGVEVVVRALFFGLNLIFNGIMWTLFTKALARGTSTTQVSILNTSSNFMITAILGFIIFSESLPPLWWVGAAMLVAGNVIIGRREEGEKLSGDEEGGEGRSSLVGEEGVILAENVELGEGLDADVEEGKRKRGEDDTPDLRLDEEDARSDEGLMEGLR